MNTNCSKCFFADTSDSHCPCVFNIPNIIKDIHCVEIQDNYYKLNNYKCRYGFNRDIYNENIDKFHDFDLVEYVKQQNIVSYSLSVMVTNNNIQNIIKSINRLSIKPFFLFLITKSNQTARQLKNILETNSPYIKFKIHNFLEKELPYAHCLHIALETNKQNMGNLMWILDDKDLETCSIDDSIQNINYMINVEQKPSHYYRKNNSESQFSGIFINSNNYWALSKTHNYEIENNEHTLVITYD